MVLDGTGGRCREGMEIIGAIGMLRGGGGGPMTPGVKEGIDDIDGMGGGPIGAELMAGGGPRLSGGRDEPNGGGIGAELTEHIEVEPSDPGPMGAAGLGKGGNREW